MTVVRDMGGVMQLKLEFPSLSGEPGAESSAPRVIEVKVVYPKWRAAISWYPGGRKALVEEFFKRFPEPKLWDFDQFLKDVVAEGIRRDRQKIQQSHHLEKLYLVRWTGGVASNH